MLHLLLDEQFLPNFPQLDLRLHLWFVGFKKYEGFSSCCTFTPFFCCYSAVFLSFFDLKLVWHSSVACDFLKCHGLVTTMWRCKNFQAAEDASIGALLASLKQMSQRQNKPQKTRNNDEQLGCAMELGKGAYCSCYYLMSMLMICQVKLNACTTGLFGWGF